jgi:hypothetical protein
MDKIKTYDLYISEKGGMRYMDIGMLIRYFECPAIQHVLVLGDHEVRRTMDQSRIQHPEQISG